MIWTDFLSDNSFILFIVALVLLVIFRKRIIGIFKRKRKVDYSSMMSNGVSFDAEFSFNKSTSEERDKYQGRLEEINKELESIKVEQSRIDGEYNKKKIMLLHREKQLSLQYNTYLNSMRNLDKMIDDQEQMEEELGK